MQRRRESTQCSAGPIAKTQQEDQRAQRHINVSNVYINVCNVYINMNNAYINVSNVYINVSNVYINANNVYINVSNVYINMSYVYIKVHINVSNVYINVCIYMHDTLFMPSHYPHITLTLMFTMYTLMLAFTLSK